MSGPGGPGHGRHSSPDGAGGLFGPGPELAGGATPGYAAPRYEPARYEPPRWSDDRADERYPASDATPDGATARFRRVSGLLDRHPDETGPLAEPEWWFYGSTDDPGHPMTARHGSDERPGSTDWTSDDDFDGRHPSAPLPPRPPGIWDRLRPRDDDDATVAQPAVGGTPGRHASDDYEDEYQDEVDEDYYEDGFADGVARDDEFHDDDRTDAQPVDPAVWEDQTGGLEVIGAHVDEEDTRRRGRRARRGERRRVVAADPDEHDDAVHDEAFGEDIPVKPYDKRTGRGRRRRSPVAIVLSLLVLGGIVFGIVVGGQKLIELINPASRDYTGQGTGEVQIRVQNGDTLSDIARTLVEANVIASVGPFVDAAEANAASTGIQPGVYSLRQEMSGQAALDLLLDPAARLLSRVTVPEGRTVVQTLAALAEQTGKPVEEFQAAAADPAALGLPAYANGMLEGFLFPATYDIEPDDAPADVLRMMVTRAVQAFDQLQIPQDQRLTVLTKASIVQAEAGSVEDMGKVARVLENRLADGMPLQLDTTVNYANGKGGITTTPQDRANPSPYNTYVHAGLPPGAIGNPGEDALRAVLNPTPGEWRFFVVVDPDTGDTRFAVTGAEHQQNVLLFQQWLRENPEG
jgi:UPF0755 protein